MNQQHLIIHWRSTRLDLKNWWTIKTQFERSSHDRGIEWVSDLGKGSVADVVFLVFEDMLALIIRGNDLRNFTSRIDTKSMSM